MPQKLVVLMEPSEDPDVISMKEGNMILNRFCIDEDAAFELSGVNNLKKSSYDIEHWDSPKFIVKRIQKGKEYSFRRSYFIFQNLVSLEN